MTALAPRWAFAAQAIDSVGDPTLTAGLHFRVIPSAELGLPIAPLAIWRVDLGIDATNVQRRDDVFWRDSRGATLTAPFIVTPDNPVTGWVPPSGTCCWAYVEATPSAATSLRVDGVVSTARGPAVLVSRSRVPHQLGASHLERLVVSGSGTVHGVRWVDANTLPVRGQPWRVMALPIEGGARYVGIGPNAPIAAEARAKRGAPVRYGLHDEPDATDAAAATNASAADEMTRLSALTNDVAHWVKRLVDDLSAAPRDLVDTQQLLDASGKVIGTTNTPLLASVLQASFDPGVGRWLGLVDVDDAPPTTTPRSVVAYVIRGLWQFDPKQLGVRATTVPPEAIVKARRPITWKRAPLTHLPEVRVPEVVERETTPCDDFADLKPDAGYGRTFTRYGAVFESLDPGIELRAVDWIPAQQPDGHPELQFPDQGVAITLPVVVPAATVRVAQFTGSAIMLEAFDGNGKPVARDVVSGPQGDVLMLKVAAADIAKLVVTGGQNEAVVTEVCTGRGDTASQCDRFTDVDPKTDLGPSTKHGGLGYESMDPGDTLVTVDWWPSGGDGLSELRVPVRGLRIRTPVPASWVAVRVVEFGDRDVVMEAYDSNGQLAGVAQAGASAVEMVLEVTAVDIAEVALGGSRKLALLEVCWRPAREDPEDPDPDPTGGEEISGPFADFSVVACATVAVPPDHLDAPALGAPQNGPWLPLTPPAAEREIVVPVAALGPGAGLALARRDGSTITGLNQRSTVGRALPVVVAPAPGLPPGSGEFYDRHAPPPAVFYRAAQADWFGRWSQWRERQALPGVRPLPPAPVFSMFYAPPNPATGIAPLSGTLRFDVTVPAPNVLPPGAFLLDALQLSINGTTTTHALPSPGAPAAFLKLMLSGPQIARAEQATVQVTARWRDAGGQFGPWSDALTRTLYDPRPPDQVTLPNTLQYAARPDATGRSRIQLAWTPTAGQARYRVFYADETGVQARLEKLAANTATSAADRTRANSILAALAAAADAPARAAVYVTHKDFLRRDGFEQLTGVPVERPASGQARFVHDVSGSLRVLSLLRLVAISNSNVETDFQQSPLVPIGVPNTGPPPQPILSVKPRITATSVTAEVTITVPLGIVPATEYRLRRSATVSDDALKMPIAATGVLNAPTGGAPQEVCVVDNGASELDAAGRLRMWHTYSWRAEARGGAEPGGGPAGVWSTASAAVTASLIPDGAPNPATGLTVATASGTTTVTWTHPDELVGGSLGLYRLDLYKHIPGGRDELATSQPAVAPASGGGGMTVLAPYTFTESAVPPGTTYRVVVVDPIGRMSRPTAPAVAP